MGYMQVSKADASQTVDLQRDALLAAGVDSSRLYEDSASGQRDDRPGLKACLQSLRHSDTLVSWKLDRLGRDLREPIKLAHQLKRRGVALYRHVDPQGRLWPDGEKLLRHQHAGRELGLPTGAPRPDAGEWHA